MAFPSGQVSTAKVSVQAGAECHFLNLHYAELASLQDLMEQTIPQTQQVNGGSSTPPAKRTRTAMS